MATSRCHLARTYCSLGHFLTGACDGWCDMAWCHRCHGVEASVVQPTMSLENKRKNVWKWTGFSALDDYSPICLRTLTDCLSLFTWRPGMSQRRNSQCKLSLLSCQMHTPHSLSWWVKIDDVSGDISMVPLWEVNYCSILLIITV